MSDDQESQLRRRRRSILSPNLALHLDAGYQVSESGPSRGTPSPSGYRSSSFKDHSPSAAMIEFRKKQQSFDIKIEECEEEEIIIESDDEGGDLDNLAAVEKHRPVTPTPIQDFGANVVYTEGNDVRGPQKMDYLNVKAIEHDCVTDVSDTETDEE